MKSRVWVVVSVAVLSPLFWLDCSSGPGRGTGGHTGEGGLGGNVAAGGTSGTTALTTGGRNSEGGGAGGTSANGGGGDAQSSREGTGGRAMAGAAVGGADGTDATGGAPGRCCGSAGSGADATGGAPGHGGGGGGIAGGGAGQGAGGDNRGGAGGVACQGLHYQCDETHPCCDQRACLQHYCEGLCKLAGASCSSTADCCPGRTCVSGVCKSDMGCARLGEVCSLQASPPVICCDNFSQSQPMQGTNGETMCPHADSSGAGMCSATYHGVACSRGCILNGYSCFNDGTPGPISQLSGTPCWPRVGCALAYSSCNRNSDCCSGKCSNQVGLNFYCAP